MNAVMLLAYFWLNEVQWTAAVAMSGCAQKTVTRFYWLYRRLAARGLSEVDTVIGGRGIIVEIDETKLGRRKFNGGTMLRECGYSLVWSVQRQGASSSFRFQTGLQKLFVELSECMLRLSPLYKQMDGEAT